MNIDEIFDYVNGNPELEGIGITVPEDGGEPSMTVLVKATGAKWVFNPLKLEHLTPEAFGDYLFARKDTQPLSYLTRVVGYFSRVENWNKSKVGELRDRHAGTYALPEPPSA